MLEAETEARSLGVGIHRLRWVILIVASLATAGAVALSGPIGFVGLICPHLGRLLVGNDQRRLLPVATGLGAILLMVADTVGRQFGSRHDCLLACRRTYGSFGRTVLSRIALAPPPTGAHLSKGESDLLLRTQAVAFGYREQSPVLRGVSLELAAGQVVALLGPQRQRQDHPH